MSPFLKALTLLSVLFLLSGLSAQSQSTAYKARYTTAAPVLTGETQIGAADGGTLVLGKWSPTIEDSSRVMVMKLDPQGNVQWSKYVNTGGLVSDFNIYEMSDGSIALAVDLQYYISSIYFSDILLVKLNCKGAVLWSDRINIPSIGQRLLQPMSVKEGKNGDLLLSFYGADQFCMVARLDNTGKAVWNKKFVGPPLVPGFQSTFYAPIVFLQDNSVLVFGFKDEFNNYYNNNKQIFAMQLNYDDGATQVSQVYQYTEFFTNYGFLGTSAKDYFNAERLENGTYALFGIFSNFNYQDSYFYKFIINKDLSINNTQAIRVPYATGVPYGRISVLPNGQTHITSQDYDDYEVAWYSGDKTFNTIRSVKIPYPNISVFGGNMVSQSGPARSSYMQDGYDMGTAKRFIEEIQVEDGNNKLLPCLGPDFPFATVVPISVSIGPWSWTSVLDNQAMVSPTPYLTGDVQVNKTYLCAPDQPNAPFTIVGPSKICTTTPAYEYHVSTTNPANKPVVWTIDQPAAATLTTLNDSTVQITFTVTSAPYTVKLTASGGVCSPTQQTLPITVYPDGGLPRYATVCTQPVQLDPGSWYSAYLWQDGSVAPVYTATKAGRYIVQLNTYCGDQISDTTDVFSDRLNLAAPPPICRPDTITLHAPGGFASYTWTPDINVIPVNDSTIEVHPDLTTNYYLTTVTPDGCSLKDTIPVTVRQPPIVSLGGDTTICQQDQLRLSVRAGYKTYTWSTGETTPSIIVSPAQSVTVEITDQNGCQARDTILIQGKSCADQLSFPNAFSPDGNGSNDLFRPHYEGRLDKYQLAVYDRYGALVFLSANPSAGWDGRRGGSIQTGAYVWTCQYKFSDMIRTVVLKGTVLLVR